MDNFAIHDKSRSAVVIKIKQFINTLEGVEKPIIEVGNDIFTSIELSKLFEVSKRLELSCKDGSELYSSIKDNSSKYIEYLTHLPLLEIFISFEPTISFEEDLIEMVSGQIQKDFTYKIESSNEVFMGAILDYNGIRYDYSFNEYFEKLV